MLFRSDTAVEVLKLGASDFIVKPFSAAALQEATRVGLEKAHLFMENRHLRHRLKESPLHQKMQL